MRIAVFNGSPKHDFTAHIFNIPRFNFILMLNSRSFIGFGTNDSPDILYHMIVQPNHSATMRKSLRVKMHSSEINAITMTSPPTKDGTTLVIFMVTNQQESRYYVLNIDHWMIVRNETIPEVVSPPFGLFVPSDISKAMFGIYHKYGHYLKYLDLERKGPLNSELLLLHTTLTNQLCYLPIELNRLINKYSLFHESNFIKTADYHLKIVVSPNGRYLLRYALFTKDVGVCDLRREICSWISIKMIADSLFWIDNERVVFVGDGIFQTWNIKTGLFVTQRKFKPLEYTLTDVEDWEEIKLHVVENKGLYMINPFQKIYWIPISYFI